MEGRAAAEIWNISGSAHSAIIYQKKSGNRASWHLLSIIRKAKPVDDDDDARDLSIRPRCYRRQGPIRRAGAEAYQRACVPVIARLQAGISPAA